MNYSSPLTDFILYLWRSPFDRQSRTPNSNYPKVQAHCCDEKSSTNGLVFARRRPIFFLIVLWLTTLNGFSQNIKYESQWIYFYRYPLKPLGASVKTYSAVLEELNPDMEPAQRDTLRKAFQIPGLTKVKEDGDVQLELIVSPLTITNKETKDQPTETDRNGKKSVMHQYSYLITYSFPMKIRVISRGRVVTEQDFSGFFTTNYFPQNNTSLSAMQSEFDEDYSFKDKLRDERVEGRKNELRNWLSSNYGSGMVPADVEIGYVKDKKGEYPDLTKAFSLLHEAYAAANKKKEYLDDAFHAKANDAIAIWEKALEEASDDKKARIDRKVTSMVYCNLAWAFYGLNEFDKVEEYLQKIKKAGYETDMAAQLLKDMTLDKRARLIANGLIQGTPPPEAAQEESRPLAAERQYRDYIIDAKGDTIDAHFLIPSQDVMPYGDSVWLEDQVVVWKGTKTIEYYPTQIQGYCYKGVFRESLTWPRDRNTLPWTMEHKFARRLVDGAISVYRYYSVAPSIHNPNTMGVSSQMYYRKDNQLLEVMFLNFDKAVSKIVAGYPALAERVRSGAYRREDFIKIMEEYNAWTRKH
jgi:tetratricopeptide (TPR) repeat protein